MSAGLPVLTSTGTKLNIRTTTRPVPEYEDDNGEDYSEEDVEEYEEEVLTFYDDKTDETIEIAATTEAVETENSKKVCRLDVKGDHPSMEWLNPGILPHLASSSLIDCKYQNRDQVSAGKTKLN